MRNNKKFVAKKMLESNKSIPKSLKRVVKFYRFFGFSFSGFNLENKPKTCNFYSIVLNIFMIIVSLMSGILYNILTNPLELREEASKTVLKVDLIIGNIKFHFVVSSLILIRTLVSLLFSNKAAIN
jgi:hypothetical protein